MRTRGIAALITGGLLLGACGASPAATGQAIATVSASVSSGTASTPVSSTPSASESSTVSPTARVATGAYLDESQYQAQKASRDGTRTVLFFHAPWCPSCRATETSLTTTGVPDGLTVVKVDFDTATELRQKYGVTVQHTFVQVAPDGSPLAKFTGTVTGVDILSHTG